MSISPGFTDDEIRTIVYEYEQQPQGTKTDWLARHGINYSKLRRWRAAVFEGDLDRGLVPRQGSSMTPRERRQKAQQSDHHQAENERLRARVRELEETNEALGKAIGLLHQLNEQEPDTPPTNEPSNF